MKFDIKGTIKVTHNTTAIELDVLIESGADESLMDWGIAKRGLKTKTFSQPIKASALKCTVHHYTSHRAYGSYLKQPQLLPVSLICTYTDTGTYMARQPQPPHRLAYGQNPGMGERL